MNRVWRLAPAVILTLLVPTASLADEPVPDTADHGEADNGVSPAEVEEAEEGWGIYFPEWFDLDAEYRVRTLRIDPLELNGDTVRDVTWTEQRARLDAQFIYPGVGRLVLQADILDGVLFGDNGTFGTDIIPTSGVSLLTRTPNNLGWTVGLPSGADPLDPDAYTPAFERVEPITIHHLFAEVNLPIGVIRFGRQPIVEGPYLAAHSGERSNRWGVSEYSDSVDRVLFATKLDQAFGMLIDGDEHVVDNSVERGLFVGVGFDWLTQGQLLLSHDETYQIPTSFFYRAPEANWFGTTVRDFEVSLTFVRIINRAFKSKVWSFPTRVEGTFGPVGIMLQFGLNLGESQEISEGFAVLQNAEPSVQDIASWGINSVIDYTLGPVTLTFEFDFATGDNDPRAGNTLSQYSFSRDLNVGLLLFEHILAFESARSAAVGVENLSSLDAASFPITEARTDGRFTNAIALFPQVKVDILDTWTNQLHVRTGVLLAWPEAGVVDPILTVLAEDGNAISDDARNFHGGDPGDYYGTEIDLQIQYAFKNAFFWTVEGAVLFPGNALHDEHGDAVNSFLFENRFELVF